MSAREYEPGEVIPGTQFKVLRLIGAGGMGTVYDVEDTTVGKRYALKTLHPELGDRDDLARRMEREARTLARIGHPNIVDVVTGGVTNDDMRLPFYVMERLTGHTLRIMLEKRHTIDVTHAVHLTIDLLDALGHAHAEGVVHRDVKPENVFIHRPPNGFSVTKLLDFGIMSLISVAEGQRETAGRFLGTFKYAAPEQLAGDRPTPLMDVYATGLVLYEAICGRGPFDDQGGGDMHAVAQARMRMPAPPVSEFLASVPPELDVLLKKVLSRDPLKRPKDAFTFRAQLYTIKKMLRGEVPPEVAQADNRSTALALFSMPGEGTTPLVDVHLGGADGGHIVSPVGSPAPPIELGVSSTRPGMPVPTVGRPFELAEPPVSSPSAEVVTSRDGIDRHAETRSQVIEPPPAGGGHGTEAFPLVTPSSRGALLAEPAPALAPTPAQGIAPLQWPPERPVASSEEPQVRTLSEVPARRSAAPLAMALVAVLGLVALGFVALVVRHPWSRSGAGPASEGVPRPVVVAAPPPAASVVTMPAPVIAPPALEDTTPAATTVAAATSTQPVSSGSRTLPPAATGARSSTRSGATGAVPPSPPPAGPGSSQPRPRVGPGF
jgi:serine/threonine protein kinase